MLAEYMAELDKIELLAPDVEAKLWHDYRDNDDSEARATLIEHYQPLVFREALRYRNAVADVMDCVQEGTVGLIEAVERFDVSKGVAFSFMRCIAFAVVYWIFSARKVNPASLWPAKVKKTNIGGNSYRMKVHLRSKL